MNLRKCARARVTTARARFDNVKITGLDCPVHKTIREKTLLGGEREVLPKARTAGIWHREPRLPERRQQKS